MTLKDKTLFITGASRGIGLAIAKRAARDGANVAVLAKTEQPNPRLPGTIYTAAEEIDLSYDNPRLLAALVALAVAWASRSVVWTIVIGMVALWLAQWWLA